jgi:WD40 repeat protein
MARFTPHPNLVALVTVNADGTLVASTDGSGIKLLDVKTGSEHAILDNRKGPVHYVHILDEGKLLVLTGGLDAKTKLWEAPLSKARPPDKPSR